MQVSMMLAWVYLGYAVCQYGRNRATTRDLSSAIVVVIAVHLLAYCNLHTFALFLIVPAIGIPVCQMLYRCAEFVNDQCADLLQACSEEDEDDMECAGRYRRTVKKV